MEGELSNKFQISLEIKSLEEKLKSISDLLQKKQEDLKEKIHTPKVKC